MIKDEKLKISECLPIFISTSDLLDLISGEAGAKRGHKSHSIPYGKDDGGGSWKGCGHTEKDNRKTQALFKCLGRGHEENADVNAAKNVLSRTHQQLAGGQPVSAYRSGVPNTNTYGVGTRLTHTATSGAV